MKKQKSVKQSIRKIIMPAKYSSLYLVLFLLLVLIMPGCGRREDASSANREEKFTRSVDRGNGFVEHGVAAPVSRARGIAATVDGAGQPVVLIWVMDMRGCYSILMVDAITGVARDYPLPFPPGDSPFAWLLSSGNKIYSLFQHKFVEFDPIKREFTFVGKADDLDAMSMAETPDGVIWAATYPGSHLIAFNPKTRELINYGSVNKETWPQYPFYLAMDSSGWIYTGIGRTKSHIVAFNPATREIRPIAKDEERQSGYLSIVRLGIDGKVYGQPHPTNGPWCVLFEGKATPIEKPPAAPKPQTGGSHTLVLGNFPDGRKLTKIDMIDKYMEILDPGAKEPRRLSFAYESEGAHILSLILGPDGKIYGSTGMPQRLFAYDPVTDTFQYPGLKGENGHLNALAIQRGHIFGALYGNGILYDYDPARPWDDQAKTNANPRRVASGDLIICRPHALIAHPDDRHLIMTGTPGYGLTGGGMMIYNIENDKPEMIEHNKLIPNQSTISLIALPDGNLVGGTAVWPGTGGETLAKEAELYIMDFEKRQITWHEVILPGVDTINDIILGPDGLVYGLAAGPTFFVFDPKTRRLTHQEKIKGYGNLAGGQGPRILLLGPDRKIYAYFTEGIVRIEPGTFQHELLAKPPVNIVAGIVLRKGRLYFTNGSRLWSYRVPGLN